MQQIRYQIWVKLMQMHQRYKCSIISLVCGKRKVCYLIIIPCGMFAKIVLNTTLPPSPCPQFSLSCREKCVWVGAGKTRLCTRFICTSEQWHYKLLAEVVSSGRYGQCAIGLPFRLASRCADGLCGNGLPSETNF